MPHRILYFGTSIWREFFSDLLFHYQENYDSKVAILCNILEKATYSKNFSSGAEHFSPPNFESMMEWEKEPGKVNRLRRLVNECEYSAGKSIGRIILANERNIGRAFSKGLYHWPSSRIQRFCLNDNRIPERIVLGTFHFIKGIIDRFKPDLVIARANGDLVSFVTWFLARRFRIPYVTCRFSKVIPHKAFWTDDFNMYNSLCRDEFSSINKQSRRCSDFASDYIKTYREQPKTIDYIAKNWERAKPNVVRKHRKLLGSVKSELLYYLSGAKAPFPRPTFFRAAGYYRTQFMQRYHKKYFRAFSSGELEKFEYIYFPQHKEPEVMLNFEAPLWHDQRHLIKFICSMLPCGYKLLVREHRFNWGRRYTDYFKSLTNLPNVVLIDPFDSQFKYIENSDLIITDNGSTGWEGLLLRKPVITLEKTFYDPPGLARRVTDSTLLDSQILNSLDKPVPLPTKDYDRLLGLFVDAERQTTIEIDEMHKKPEMSVQYIDKLLKRMWKGEGLTENHVY